MPSKVIPSEPDYDTTLSKGGFRFTRQRRVVYDALMGQRDHPTAVEVFLRVKEQVPGISLATVYNCLETLTRVGLIRHVNLDRAPARFCPNLAEHGHFFCEHCGKVIDVPLVDATKLARTWKLPKGCSVTHHEFFLRGLCPECTAKNN